METENKDQPVPQSHDPENDIDAKSATWWVLGGTVLLFISLWIMLPIFTRVQEVERRKKVDLTPNTELNEVLEAQNRFLSGANPTKKTLDQAIAEALRK